MSQATLRKWHRRVGATIALFVILQAGSGFLLVAEDWFEAPAQGQGEYGPGLLGTIHFGAFPAAAGPVFDLYRMLLGAGLCFMACSGGYISILVKRAARTRSRAGAAAPGGGP